MVTNLSALGVLFDWSLVEEASYGRRCWEVFWHAVDPSRITTSLLWEGDAGHDGKHYCIGIQPADAAKLNYIKDAISASAEFKKVAGHPMFIEGAACIREPLIDAGRIDAAGNWVGSGGNAGVMLDFVRSERAPRDVALSPNAHTSRTASALTSALPKWASVEELDRFCRKATSLPSVTDTEYFWITPEELCDIVESAGSIADVYFSTFSCGNSSDLCRVALREKSNPSQWLAFSGLYPIPSLEHFVNEWDFPAEYQKMRPVLAGVKGRFVMNFQNDGARPADSKDLIEPASLWPRLYARRAKFLEEIERTENGEHARPEVEREGELRKQKADERRATEGTRSHTEQQRNLSLNYYVCSKGRQFGPYTLGQLGQFASEGRCRTSDLAWSPFIGQWMPLFYVLMQQQAISVSPTIGSKVIERKVADETRFQAELQRNPLLNYYLWMNGQQFGPYTLEQLSQFASERRCGPSDLAWSPSVRRWIPLSYVLTQQQAVPANPVIYSPAASIMIRLGGVVFAVVLFFVIVPFGAFALERLLGVPNPWNVVITISVWYLLRMVAKRYSAQFQAARG